MTVTVDLDQFAANIRFIKQSVAPSKVCVVLKADAYGHGITALAPVAIAAGADRLGVCTNGEIAAIRTIDAQIPIMRLRSGLPEELEEALQWNVEELAAGEQASVFLDRLGVRRGLPVPVHVKIDSGMGRGGFLYHDAEGVREIRELPGVKIVGVMTHLANADAPDLNHAREQLRRFDTLIEQSRDALPPDALIHTHNSAGTWRMPERRGDMVRVGAACYGVRTSQAFDNPPELKPIMALRTAISGVARVPAGHDVGYGTRFVTERESVLATVPVGFGEGYPRALFNKGEAIISGKLCRVAGRVSLNVTTFDVTDLDPPPQWGDPVTLIGQADGLTVTFEEMADRYESVHTDINLMAGRYNPIQYIGGA
ncbi:putative alanine racemase [Magnetofaba australis IT-1]|uniref:Putative alanine racemase n=2 Tax=Magnetofaba TaxID=1472292 RepID=A0A1Y2K201_9PROT|nr:putative alanine racemase [Magnetofaba australis IT-1]